MINLLNTNELYGERVTTVDLKLAKNFRFRNTRATVGVDVYNLFNSDAIQDYIDTYTIDRFARLSVQFYF